MQTRSIDALRLWWRQINFTQGQKRALTAVALISIVLSAFYILKPANAIERTNETSNMAPVISAPPLIVVDVAGEVYKPGVYELPPNSRVNDAIKAAGGPRPSADLSLINLARLIKDGEQIFVERKYSVNQSAKRPLSKPRILNLNRASAKDLEELPGIGPVLAARIVEYRSSNGSFTSVDELAKVPGIGSSKLAKFKEKLRV